METILRIEEASFKKSKEDYGNYDGYQIVTNKQTIKLGIDMQSSCCETPGYFWSNDDFKKFIGAKINKIEIVDTCLNTKRLDDEYAEDGGDTMFVNISTDRGILQFTAYNGQNGYYGHEAVILSEQLTEEKYL